MRPVVIILPAKQFKLKEKKQVRALYGYSGNLFVLLFSNMKKSDLTIAPSGV
jgi:hypothetical protein